MWQTIIKIIADLPIFLIIIVFGYTLLKKWSNESRYDAYTKVFMAGISSYVLAKFIGNMWQPEQLRPFELIGVNPGATYLNNPGFPSDHALLGFFIVFAIWYYSKNMLLTTIATCLTVLMCVGRVLALVHTPIDILGSLIITVVATFWYSDYVQNRKNKKLADKAKI